MTQQTRDIITQAKRLFVRVFLAATVLLITINSSPVSAALTDNQLNVLNSGIPYFNTETCNPAPAAGNSSLNGYTLPADSGNAGQGSTIDSNGLFNDPTSPDKGQPIRFANVLKRIPLADRQPYQDYYIAMRWKYKEFNWDGTGGVIDQTQANWMGDSNSVSRPRLILVTNNKTGASIVADALGEGPAPWEGVDPSPNNIPKDGWQNPLSGTPLGWLGQVSGFPPKAMTALGITTSTSTAPHDPVDLTFTWAPDQTVTPGPATVPQQSVDSQTCTGAAAGLNNTVFESQRDPRWKGQIICWGSSQSGGCAPVYNEGCWATSAAMIISTFLNKQYPHEITPMQTEGNGQPPESFSGAGLVDIGFLRSDFAKIKPAIQQGALVFIHGSGAGPDGGPFYNTPTHWEMVRGIAANGNYLISDPWDLPDPAHPSLPLPQQPANGGTYQAHSLREWTQNDVQPYTLDFEVVYPKGKTVNL